MSVQVPEISDLHDIFGGIVVQEEWSQQASGLSTLSLVRNQDMSGPNPQPLIPQPQTSLAVAPSLLPEHTKPSLHKNSTVVSIVQLRLEALHAATPRVFALASCPAEFDSCTMRNIRHRAMLRNNPVVWCYFLTRSCTAHATKRAPA